MGPAKRLQPLTPRIPEPRPESLRDLVDQYVQRHTTLENYNLAFAFLFGTLRRLDIDPMSWRGRLGVGVLVGAVVLGAPLAVTAALGEWRVAPVRLWALVALGFTVLFNTIYGPFQRAIGTFLTLHRAIADEAGIRRLIAWDRRWFSLRVAAPFSIAFAFAMLVFLYLVEIRSGEGPLAWGTALVGMMILYQVGEITYSLSLLGLESFLLRDYDYELYRLSPIDSVAVRRSIRGSNQLGVLVSLLATAFILGFVVLLGDRPTLVRSVAGVLLVLAYVATLVGVFLPRMAMRWIVQLEKEREMGPLQRRLDELAAKVQQLSAEQFLELKRLKETHDAIRDSSESVLPLRTVGRLLTSLILPTLTFLMTRFGEHFFANLINQLRR